MDAAAEAAQHFGGMGEIAWLAEDFPVEHDDRIGSQHEIAAQGGGHGQGLQLRIGQDKIAWGQPSLDFFHSGRSDDNLESRGGKQLPATRRGRSKNQAARGWAFFQSLVSRKFLDQLLGVVESDILADRFQMTAGATG